jgi:hypothetical protein
MFKVKCKSCENRLEDGATGVICDECLWPSGLSEFNKAEAEIVRLRGVVEKAWASGWISRSYVDPGKTIDVDDWTKRCQKFLDDNGVERVETK